MKDSTEPAGLQEAGRIRSFLDHLPSSVDALDPSHEDEQPITGSSVRAYLITGGRTEAVEALGFEVMLSVTPAGRHERKTLAFERSRIVELCNLEPKSVAELAAKLRIPITVVQVLAADMVSVGTLDQHAGQEDLADDVDMLQRLIHGIRSL